MQRIYLDHTATTPLDKRVLESMEPYFTMKFGNASSIHSFGQESKAALDESRDVIARCIGASSGEIIFTGSGTESDNAAIKGSASAQRRLAGKNHIITGMGEHHAVLASCRALERDGYSVTYLPVDGNGRVSPEDVRAALKESTGLVTIMHANNEVGSVNHLAAIGADLKARRVTFHSDAVQSFGKIALNVDELGVDICSLSAHKIYGPKGIGAMYIRRGTLVDPIIHGGAQERGRRAGTENVPLAVGFARAASLVMEERESEGKRLSELRARFRRLLVERLPSIIINGSDECSLPHILNISFDSKRIRIDGEALLFNLDLAGIAVTSGSACTSGNVDPSHVLLAMGRNVLTAKASIRFSMGRSTTWQDLDNVVHSLCEIVQRTGSAA